jgi:hypothetical protein
LSDVRSIEARRSCETERAWTLSRGGFPMRPILYVAAFGLCGLVACGGPKSSNGRAPALLQPDAVKHVLAVVRAGSGSVQSLPGGISCGSACAAAFDGDAKVSL